MCVLVSIARRGKELAELSSWLMMAIKRRNAKNSNKLADFLRQKAFPFLDEFGEHPDALPHILKMYDVSEPARAHARTALCESRGGACVMPVFD
jgi:hypothetical protein